MDFDRVVHSYLLLLYIVCFVFSHFKLSFYYMFVKYAMIDAMAPEITKLNDIYNKQHAVQCSAVPCNNIIFNFGTLVLLFLPNATDIFQLIEPFLA